MRVTQSMLSSNMLRNLNSSYGKMSKLQDQINSGKKISRPSDDPVVAVKGMNYRTSLDRVSQFKRNVGEAVNWLDTTDSTLGEVGDALNRVKELVIQAANDSNTADDREKIKAEIDQIREQIRDLGNTQVGGKYMFTGTNTQKPLYVDVKYYDHTAIQQHTDGLYNTLKTATDAHQSAVDAADTPPTAEQQAVIDDLNTKKTDAQNAVTTFEAATAVDGTGKIIDETAYKSYLDANNIPQKFGRVLNGKYQDKDNNTINPFDSFADMTLTTTDKTTIPATTTVKSLPLLPNPPGPTLTAQDENVKIEVFDNIQLPVNTVGLGVFNQIDQFMNKVSEALKTGSDTNNATDISDLLGGVINLSDPSAKGTDFSDVQAALLATRAEVGAKQNRVELMENRLDIHKINVTKQLSENEDVDYSEAITEMVTAESIHQAALSVGAKIIQQTLVDFMR